MGIQRAGVLYPVNSTVVDTPPASGDIRLLSDAQAGADDDTQSVSWTHTQDSVGRTWDPGNTLVTTVDGVGSVPLRFGYGLRKTEDLTPADDTNCNPILRAQTLTVNINVRLNQTGGTYTGGNYAPSFRAALWRYNPSTDVEILISSVADSAGITWDYTPVTGDLNTFKVIPISMTIAETEVSGNQIYVLELGLNTGTVPNPTVGTATWVATLRVDNADTNITFEAGKSIVALCRVSEAGNAAARAAGRKYIRQARRQARAAAAAVGARHVEAYRAGSAASAARAFGSKYIRQIAHAAASAASAAGWKYVRLIPRAASSAAAAQGWKYVKLLARSASSAAAAVGRRVLEGYRRGAAASAANATGRRVLEGVRRASASSAAAASGIIKMGQDVLNRITGGGTTLLKKVIVYDRV